MAISFPAASGVHMNQVLTPQARLGIAVLLPLLFVRAAPALVVCGPDPELRGAVFGQIVPQPLPQDPGHAAVPDHLMTVAGNGAEMANRMHGISCPLSVPDRPGPPARLGRLPSPYSIAQNRVFCQSCGFGAAPEKTNRLQPGDGPYISPQTPHTKPETPRVRNIIPISNRGAVIGMDVTGQEYRRMSKRAAPASPVLVNCLKAFVFGGGICALGQAIVMLGLQLGLPKKEAGILCSLSLIALSVLLTGGQVYDNIARHAGAGTLVPITGFANSIASTAIEFKSEERVIITPSQKCRCFRRVC